MKMLYLLVISLILPTMLWAGGNIAILDLTITAGVTASDQQMIADRLEMELIATKVYTVLERRKISNMLSEQGFQQSGACEGSECQVQMGQLLGVDQIVTGSLGKIGSVYTMNVKIVDVLTGAIQNSQSVDIKGELSDVLTKGCKELANRISTGQASTATEVKKSNKGWWIAGGVTILAAVGVGTYIALQPGESKTETIERAHTIGTDAK